MRSLRITNSIQSPSGIRWRRVYGLLALAVPALLLSAKLLLAVYAAAGDLDPSFGTGGSIEGTFFHLGVREIAVQADGKLLAIGGSTNPQGDFKLMRFNSGGNVDTSFGSDGSVVMDFGGYDGANALAVQADGKILVAGGVSIPNNYNLWLVRFTVNGSLDSTFSNDGRAMLGSAAAYDMVLQPDGKVIVVGLKRFAGDYRAMIARFNPNGSLDSSFGTYGVINPDVWEGSNDYGFRNVVLQNDGKIVVLSSTTYPDLPYRYRLLRYSATGQLDSSFGFNGVFASADNEDGQHLLLQADGKLVVAGAYTGQQFNAYGALIRHNTDGSLDPSFANGGKMYAFTRSFWTAIAQQDDGRLVVAGNNGVSTGQAMLSRYQADGLLDTGFGVNGQSLLPSHPGGLFYSLVLQFDGRIVGAGRQNGEQSSVLARFKNDEPTPADLQIGNVRIVPTPANPGDVITYTIPVTNLGPGKAGHVTLTTQTATHTTFQGFSAPPGWVIYKRPAPFSAGVISCSAYELPAGSTVNFYLTVRVSSSIAPGTQISHASTVSSFMPDPDETNNTATRTITVQ